MAADGLRAPPWRREHHLVVLAQLAVAGADIVQRGVDVVAKDHQRVNALESGLHPVLSPLHTTGIRQCCKGLEGRKPVRAHVSRPALTAQRAANRLPACRFLLRVTTHGTDLQVRELACAAETPQNGQRRQRGRLGRRRDRKGLRWPQRVGAER